MTAMFSRRAGEHVAQSTEDEAMSLLGADSSATVTVKVPAHLGGGTFAVTGRSEAPCPVCERHGMPLGKSPGGMIPWRAGAKVPHLALANGMGVAECPIEGHGFVWYRAREAAPAVEAPPAPAPAKPAAAARPSRKGPTKLQVEVLKEVCRVTLAGGWHRARRSGERVTLASLYRNGVCVRRARRGAEGEADAAYEYRAAPAVIAKLRDACQRQP